MSPSMRPYTREQVADHYRRCLEYYGPVTEALAYTDGDAQRIRLDILADAADYAHSTVLDVGCGFGDFHGVLTRRGIPHAYTGLDISAAFIEIARARYPDARFAVADVEHADLARSDYVIASGLFFLQPADFICAVVPRLFAAARRALIFNMLSTGASRADVSEWNMHEPGGVLTELLRVSPWVAVWCDYLADDFTVRLSHEPRRPTQAPEAAPEA